MLKGDIPMLELIGGAATGSLPMVLNNGLPPIWNGELEDVAGKVACME
jgi:hypothetical protein